MNKFYTIALALFVSFAASAQSTTIDLSAIDAAYTKTVDDVLVLDVATASSTIAAPLVSFDNPFKGKTFSKAEISFDINNYMGADSIKVLGSLLSIFDAELGRMYFTNGSYLGYNDGAFVDLNLNNYGLGVDFLGGNAWKNVKIQVTSTGIAVLVDNVLAFDQNSTAVIVANSDPAVDYAAVITFLQNASTLAFGAGSWWSDNTRPDGTYWDAQFSYLKNITFTPDFGGTTAINSAIALSESMIVNEEYFMINGAKAGNNFDALVPGIYIKKLTYSNGAVQGTKVLRTIQ